MSIQENAAYEIARRAHNKKNPLDRKPNVDSTMLSLTGVQLRLLAGVTVEPKAVRTPKVAKPRIAGTSADKRKAPRVFMADGVTPVPEDLKAKATAIYESGKRGVEYHKACAKAGIPTTKTVWVGDKVRLAK